MSATDSRNPETPNRAPTARGNRGAARRAWPPSAAAAAHVAAPERPDVARQVGHRRRLGLGQVVPLGIVGQRDLHHVEGADVGSCPSGQGTRTRVTMRVARSTTVVSSSVEERTRRCRVDPPAVGTRSRRRADRRTRLDTLVLLAERRGSATTAGVSSVMWSSVVVPLTASTSPPFSCGYSFALACASADVALLARELVSGVVAHATRASSWAAG